MVDIFISYASEDRSRVEALAKVLEDQGWTLWWDRSLPVAKPWHKLIEEAVDNARAILVVWSSTSVESDWVLAEAEDGLKRRILVPVLFEAVRIPLLFRSIQAANLIKWEEDQSDTNFKQLKQALISILGSPKQKKSKDLSEPSEQEPSEPAKTFKNTIGMKFVLIPADTFIMGSQKGEKDFDMFEKQHKVTLTKQYYLQNTTVTQKQWKRIIGTDPSRFIECGDECPVEKVSWNDTQQFISKLNNIENTNNYRLPTEAEWEFACRAGSTTIFCFGNDEKQLKEYAWYGVNSDGKTHPVAQKKPNKWGLYDMHGNVGEWCSDWFHKYPTGHVTDPKGPDRSNEKVCRGGSARFGAKRARSAARKAAKPVYCSLTIGFRVARDC